MTAVWSTVVFSTLQSILTEKEYMDILELLDSELSSRGGQLSNLSTIQYLLQRRWLEEGHVTQWEALFGPLGGVTWFKPHSDTSYVTIIIPQLHPFSRGNVVSRQILIFITFRSTNVTVPSLEAYFKRGPALFTCARFQIS